MARLRHILRAYLIVCLAGGVYATDIALHRPRVPLTANDTAQARALASELDADCEVCPDLRCTYVPGDDALMRSFLATSRPSNYEYEVRLIIRDGGESAATPEGKVR